MRNEFLSVVIRDLKLDVIDGVLWVAPGVHEDAPEAGEVSRGRLGDLIEAEAEFRAHGTVRDHPHFGGSAGV